jgi:hypothetical protein
MEDYEAHLSTQGSPTATLGDVADFGVASRGVKNPKDDAYNFEEAPEEEES